MAVRALGVSKSLKQQLNSILSILSQVWWKSVRIKAERDASHASQKLIHSHGTNVLGSGADALIRFTLPPLLETGLVGTGQ